MEDELDAFDFELAEVLSMTVREMNDRMGADEYLKWRAFFVYRNAQRELAAKESR